MGDVDRLIQLGWGVRQRTEGDVQILLPDAHPEHGWVTVNLNADGSLHLVKERSADHRRIASALGQPVPEMPAGMS